MIECMNKKSKELYVPKLKIQEDNTKESKINTPPNKKNKKNTFFVEGSL
jgi:hypothetical protein